MDENVAKALDVMDSHWCGYTTAKQTIRARLVELEAERWVMPDRKPTPKLGPEQDVCDGYIHACGYADGWNACRDAMQAPARPRTETWKLVPVVASPEMLDAAIDAFDGFNGEEEVDAVWAAMLAAASAPDEDGA